MDKRRLVFAWLSLLLVSNLPDILFQEVLGSRPAWLLTVKLIFMLLVLLAGLVWRQARSVRLLFVALFVLYLGSFFFTRLGQSPQWVDLFDPASFTSSMLGIQLGRLAVAAAVILVLFLFGKNSEQLYLSTGNLSAKAGAVRWLGIDQGTSWRILGPVLAGLIGMGTLAFLLAGNPPLQPAFGLVLAILALAAMNAFSEEAAYRSAFLGSLSDELGVKQSVLISAAFFGIGHYYGVPNGFLGSLMAGGLGWLLGKAMVETRGFFWPWFIHFVQDVLIFTVLAFSW
jgi:membrane protease YdiL (CAAX protease family)